jgi:casein kinase II subunit alpha
MSTDNYEQLIKIVELLGSDELLKFQMTYRTEIQEQYKISGFKKKNFNDFVNDKNSALATKEAIDLVLKLLTFDPIARISAKDALEHPFFKS